VKFSRCAFEDAAGGAVVVAQQYNSAKLVFDRCTMSAAAKPGGAWHLALFRTSGIARLDVELRNVEIHDNGMSALKAEAAGSSTINLLMENSRIERLGRAAIEVVSRDDAHAAFTLRGTTIHTPGNMEFPAVDVAASRGTNACADFIGNQIVTGGVVPSVRLAPGVAACR
jgi:hypothetical protein